MNRANRDQARTDPLAAELREQYQAFMDVLIEQSLLLDANPLEIRESVSDEPPLEGTDAVASAKEHQVSLVWAGASGLSYLFTEHSSIEQYLEILKRRDFNFLLFDGSVVQIHYRVRDKRIVWHRLCFYPCPFDYPGEGFEELGIADIPELMVSSDFLRAIRLATPLRFDFDIKVSDDKHSHSHVTFNRSSCRLPAYGPISLGHFMKFVFRYFYEGSFETAGWWPEISPKLYARTLSHPYPHEFHLQSSVGFE